MTIAERDGGQLAASVLRSAGVDRIFTLSGGHLFPLYDGAVKESIELIDTRHEQSAVFAAEGWAKVTRSLGAAALTAGPGVTNGVSAITSAYMSGSPIAVLGGRAPQYRWGVGSLQELDHLPILNSVTKYAATATGPESIGREVATMIELASSAHRGPTFVDVPLDAWGPAGSYDTPSVARPAPIAPDPEAIAAIARLVSTAHAPVVIAGGDVYWDRAENALVTFAESARVPVIVNGLGRGVIPADHPLALSRARSAALRGADLILVIGTPLDFRLGFGDFGGPRVVHIADAPEGVATHVELAARAAGDLTTVLTGLAEGAVGGDHEAWVAALADDEAAQRSLEADALSADADPILPTRVYGELRSRLARDAIVIGDGGDFVSYAGKLIDTFTPGCFLDPGPYGCLGVGPGYALAAGLAHPDRQVVLLLGDGATGFAMGDFDTLIRHGVDVVAIVGNNGIWGLEKHPMQLLYGYDVVADLRPGTRYDQVVEALGGHGEFVEHPADIGAALDRAFATPGVSLVNVCTDPADAYPRRSNLA